jgi:hypothetical protein
MLGQVTVRTESPTILKPMLRAAIHNEARQLAHGIKRTQERLTIFEERFGMRSAEFERRFEAGEFDETLDYIDWLMEIQALRLLHEQHQAMANARLD